MSADNTPMHFFLAALLTRAANGRKVASGLQYCRGPLGLQHCKHVAAVRKVPDLD